MKKIIHFFLVFFFAFSANVFANDNVDNPLRTFEGFGFTYTINNDQVKIIINQDKILSSIPELQKAGVMSQDLTQTDLNFNKVLYSTMTGLYLTGASMSDIYSNHQLDKLHFKAYLIVPDDYGNDKKHLIYEFNFNKALNSKINWDNMTVDRFMKIAPGFQFSNWYTDNIEEQADEN